MVSNAAKPPICLVFCTCPDEASARHIAGTLVTERHAACVNIVPGIVSVYRWQGSVENDAEVMLLVKTRKDALDRLTRRVQELHPYELPEIVAVGLDGGSGAYLDWVFANTEPRDVPAE